jgi:hypothetical protein
MTGLSAGRVAELTLLMAETSLASAARDHAQVPADLRLLLSRYALDAPNLALRLPHVRAALAREVVEAARRAAAGIDAGYARVHRAADKLLPRECAAADGSCSGQLDVAFQRDAPAEFIRRDTHGGVYYDGPRLADGYKRLCRSHHLWYDWGPYSGLPVGVVSAQASALNGRNLAAAAAKGASSEQVSARTAARLLGITDRAVRMAAAKGTLAGAKNRVTGEWRIDRVGIETYWRRREQAVATDLAAR